MSRNGRRPRSSSCYPRPPPNRPVEAAAFAPIWLNPMTLSRVPPPLLRPSTARPSSDQRTQEKPVLERGRTGVVANYNQAEGFGFITVDEKRRGMAYDTNLFVHHTSLPSAALTKGDKVKFDVARGRKGFEAINVQRFEPFQGRQTRSRAKSVSILSEKEIEHKTDRRGEVIDYDVVKRFGVVKCFGEERTLLAHHSRFKPPLTNLRVGQLVKFNIVDGPRGPCADQIEEIADRPTRPSRTRAPDLKEVLSSELQCSFCLDLLSEDAVMTKCDHYFCRSCVERWLDLSQTCPQCRARVMSDDLKPVPRLFKNLIEKARSEVTSQ